MEKQHSVEFFTSFVENLQNLCQMYLSYEQYVEVTGFISVEMDNNRKERYVLSEILQASGNILSESYCTKVSKTPAFVQETTSINKGKKPLQEQQRNPSHKGRRQQQHDEYPNSKRAANFDDDEPQLVSFEIPPAKVKRLNPTNRVRSPLRSQCERRTNSLPSLPYSQESSSQMGQVPNLEEQKYHELDGPSSFGSSELRKGSTVVQDDMPTWTTANSDDQQANTDSSLGHISLSSRSEHQKRSWHVTKEEFPLETFSNTQPKPQPQVEKEEAVSKGVLRTSVDNIITDSSTFSDSSHHGDHLSSFASFPVSVDNVISNSTVICKQEPDLPTYEDATVYTDVDIDEDASNQDYNDYKPLSTRENDSEKDYIVIDLDSDNEDLSLDDTESFTYTATTSDAPQRDLSSFSKPQQFAVNRLVQFLEIKKIAGPIWSLPPEQLDPVLGEFYLRVRKCGGQEFGSRSLKTIQQYLEVFLRSNNYPASITKGPEFQNSRDIITAKVKQLRIHEESSLTLKREDVDHLYAYGQLGDSSPEAIINTLWLMNTIRLNIKGCKKHADLKWGDIMLQTVSDGKEVIVYGGSNLFVQKDLKRPSRCFVNVYKKYWAMRPQDTLDSDSPFYLAPGDQGFKRSKYGSRIGTVFKRMLINGGLSSDMKITNIDIL